MITGHTKEKPQRCAAGVRGRDEEAFVVGRGWCICGMNQSQSR